MSKPTKHSILAAIDLYEEIGEPEFLRRFATGHSPKEFYLRHDYSAVPLKALWAAAHTPPITTGPFTTDQAKSGFVLLGFDDWGRRENLLSEPVDEKADAINDLDSNNLVNTRTSVTTNYVRDQVVRAQVMRRAAGKCEYCGAQGFSSVEGSPYLESHHIIRLADDGKDKRTNVIALCANHHREAHFGVRRDELERRMKQIVDEKEAARKIPN